MKKNIEKTCINCKYFTGYTCREKISSIIEAEQDNKLVISRYPFLICNHKKCFNFVKGKSIVNGSGFKKIRITGQGHLNKDNDCKFFKKDNVFYKIYKFFFKKIDRNNIDYYKQI